MLTLFPRHCSKVCFRRVSFPLTKENVERESFGKIVLSNTKYIVLTDGLQWTVARILKSTAAEKYRLLKRIESIEIISSPEDTGFVKDPTVNVDNPSYMARIAENQGKQTVVVHGRFDHISFISNEKPVPLAVFDFIPPNPPKLIELVERALDTGRIRKPIKIVPNILDLYKLAKASKKPFVMFPCHAGDSNCGKNILSLVGTPNISSIPIENIVLIGCDVSLRTFQSVYRKKPTFIDMCPLHRKEVQKKGGMKCIARCDKIGEGHLRIGDTAYVSFDPKICEVEEAILDLFEFKSLKTASYKTLPALRFLINLVVTLLRHVSRTARAKVETTA